jgi:hypothetical protein
VSLIIRPRLAACISICSDYARSAPGLQRPGCIQLGAFDIARECSLQVALGLPFGSIIVFDASRGDRTGVQKVTEGAGGLMVRAVVGLHR